MSETADTVTGEWTGSYEVPVTQALYSSEDRHKKFVRSEPDKKGRSLRLRAGELTKIPARTAARYITEAVVYAGTDRYIKFLSRYQDKRRRYLIKTSKEHPGLHGVFHDEDDVKVTVTPSYKVDFDTEKVQAAAGPHAPTVVTESMAAQIEIPPNIETPLGPLTPELADTLVRNAITGAVGSKEVADTLVSTETKRKVQKTHLTELLISGMIAEEDINNAGVGTETWAVKAGPIDTARQQVPAQAIIEEPITQLPVFELAGDQLQPTIE